MTNTSKPYYESCTEIVNFIHDCIQDGNSVVVIMRGIPGSGKSTLTNAIIEHTTRHTIVHSTDTYHYKYHEDISNVTYDFNHDALYRYHSINFDKFCTDCALADKTHIVICDNTNLRVADVTKYAKAAKDLGRTVIVIDFVPKDVEFHKRNIHTVPEDVLQKMIDTWNDATKVLVTRQDCIDAYIVIDPQ